MQNEFNLPELINEGQVITSDGYLEHSLRCSKCVYYKSDAIYSAVQWRGETLGPLIKRQRSRYSGPLILGHSDQETSKVRSTILYLRGYEQIFGVNVQPYKGFARPIPIGLTNETDESFLHKLFGDRNLLLRSISESDLATQFRGSVYGNFSVSTNRRERSGLATLLIKNNLIFEEPEMSENGRLNFLSNIRVNNFTVCPVGNGLDTHRLWETLYLGGIPIVIRSQFYESLLRGLPCLFVDNWNQILDRDFLEYHWWEIQQKSYSFEKLSLQYWIERFHEVTE